MTHTKHIPLTGAVLNNGRFEGREGAHDKRMADIFKWSIQQVKTRQRWPAFVPVTQTKPHDRVLGDELVVSWVGHSTVLVQTNGLNFLTDPVWATRASPVFFAGPKRVSKPGIAFHDLPKIDVVLLSHNHYDHMDLKTLRALHKRDAPSIITPLGNEKHLAPLPATLLNWGQHVALTPEIKVHVEEAYHWSARKFGDKRESLWGSFVVETPHGHIYFAGDTGYGSGRIFKEKQQKYGGFRLALLPIGAYEPRWFMRDHHCNPQEAVQIMEDLNAAHAMAIHFETFQLTDEAHHHPRQHLQEALNAHSTLNSQRFRALPIGGSWTVPKI